MKYRKVGIAACSDSLSEDSLKSLDKLEMILHENNMQPVFCPYIFSNKTNIGVSGRHRAEALMDLYNNPEISDVFDVSGGDIANEVIPYLDFDLIKNSNKTFWGYSDLTTILNSINSKTGKSSVLYQIRNIVANEERRNDFFNYFNNKYNGLFDFPYEFIKGEKMSGITVGGNIRCFLKLAGTDCFPDLNGKILLLESFCGGTAQMITYLSQLKMMGAFDKINGIVLGTFTKLEKNYGYDIIINLVKQYCGNLPIIKTKYIGHGVDSCAVEIGKYYTFTK